MKFLKTLPSLLTALLLSLAAFPVAGADEPENLLERFDRELLTVMSGFAAAREAGVSSSFRQSYLSSLDKFVSDAAALQEIASELGIGEDLNLAAHARTIRESLQIPPKSASDDSKQKDNKKKSNVAKANDPITRMTGRSLSDYAGLEAGGTSSSPAQGQSAGFSFHMAGNAVQTLSSLGFGLRNGQYSVSPRYRRILPYLELKRDVEYFNASYEHFDTLVTVAAWRSDFEKRLKRMTRLAAQVQPVYRAYFPGKSIAVGTETERLARTYSRFLEYVKAVEQAEQASSRLNGNNSAFDQVRQSSIPDKGLILRDYDTAASRLAEFFADMDSVDWTVEQFSEKGPSAPSKDDKVSLPAKKTN